jgi:hypothetical protein
VQPAVWSQRVKQAASLKTSALPAATAEESREHNIVYCTPAPVVKMVLLDAGHCAVLAIRTVGLTDHRVTYRVAGCALKPSCSSVDGGGSSRGEVANSSWS